MQVKFVKFHSDAQLPQYKHKGDAGMDVTSVEEVLIPAGEYRLVHTGLGVEIPDGMEMQVRARSGLALKHGLGLVNGIGTIDNGYRGEVGVLLYNHGKEDFLVEKGMRIAQFVFANYVQVEPIEVAELSQSDRGEGGYGSSGLK